MAMTKRERELYELMLKNSPYSYSVRALYLLVETRIQQHQRPYLDALLAQARAYKDADVSTEEGYEVKLNALHILFHHFSRHNVVMQTPYGSSMEACCDVIIRILKNSA